MVKIEAKSDLQHFSKISNVSGIDGRSSAKDLFVIIILFVLFVLLFGEGENVGEAQPPCCGEDELLLFVVDDLSASNIPNAQT